MNEIVNKVLLARGKFIPEMHLRQPGFTYRACGPFTRNKERIQKFKETKDLGYIYQNELNKACFQHDMVYEDFKDLTKKTAFIKYCVLKHLLLLKIQNMMDVNRDLALMVYNFSDKKTSGGAVKNENMSNKELAKELNKPIIRKFEK